MKISIDYDGTLTRPDIKTLAKELIKAGHELIILTNRHAGSGNADLVADAAELNMFVSYNNSDYTLTKKERIKELGIELHLDDDWDEHFDIVSLECASYWVQDFTIDDIKEYLAEKNLLPRNT